METIELSISEVELFRMVDTLDPLQPGGRLSAMTWRILSFCARAIV